MDSTGYKDTGNMTTPNKTNAELPASEKSLLLEYRAKDDPSDLYARVVALRAAEWPLRSIADVLHVSRMAVQIWDRGSKDDPAVQEKIKHMSVPTLPTDARGSGVYARRMRVVVPEKDRDVLVHLAEQAKKVRRGTDPKSEQAIASKRLDELVLKYRKRGVTPMEIARSAGVTRRAIVARLDRLDAERESRRKVDA